ncbi:hypothetical protein LTR05_007019 [Lithohypha guttulata]|uniref:Mitochondrial chaperone BCS1 n=1 Tax=Lithohypha guttulata TaxID=1690604 RepID=A0AAN7SWW8_9EURO|nr:hypothetical protein LTR05_007019 [Lithohypha guttulata]
MIQHMTRASSVTKTTYNLAHDVDKIYSTSFVASRNGPPALPWTGPSDDEPILGAQDEDEEDGLSLAARDFDAYWVKRIARDKSRPIAYSPGNGSHYVKFGRSFLKLRRKGDLSGLGLGNIRLTCLGRDGGVLKRLLTEAQIAYLERDGKQTSIFRNQQSEWVQSTSRPPRDLATIVLADVQKKVIIEDIKEYLHPLTKKWYRDHAIPYRRGYLLSGPPGTGKTSLCFALAGFFQLPLYIASLSSIPDESGLSELFAVLPERSMILLEDVDAAGITDIRAPVGDAASEAARKSAEHRHKEKESRISLSALLNAIDGILSGEGRILLMTTNHVEQLDPALSRPGRIDMTVHFENITTKSAMEYFQTFYSTTATFNTTSESIKKYQARKLSSFDYPETEEEVAQLARIFAKKIPNGEFSPAELQGYLLLHKYRPDKAILGAEQWIKEVRLDRKLKMGPMAATEKSEELVEPVETIEVTPPYEEDVRQRRSTRARSKSVKSRSRRKAV